MPKALNSWYLFFLLVAPIGCLVYVYILGLPLGVNKQNIPFDKLFYLIILFPIIEELAFRGVIQEYLASIIEYKIGNIFSISNILTSILFVSIHLVAYPLELAIFIMVPSLIFGYFKEQYNSIYPSIIMHMFYNANYFILVS